MTDPAPIRSKTNAAADEAASTPLAAADVKFDAAGMSIHIKFVQGWTY